jgi:hypothetical protein
LRLLRVLAEQAAAEHSWQEALKEPGTRGNVARYLQSLDDTIRDVAPELKPDERQVLWNAWLEDIDWWEGMNHTLDYRSYILGWKRALLQHEIIVPPPGES